MEEIIRPWIHEHPMSRMGAEGRDSLRIWCGGCYRYFIGGETAYGCRRNECEFPYAFHKECLEMPREIRHGAHPPHTLTLAYGSGGGSCAVCDDASSYGREYRCKEGCDQVWIHMGCAGGFEEGVDGAEDAHAMTKHPSHPQHLLRFSKRKTLCCDACGTGEKGNSYVCTVCDYSLHERCARLPESARFPHHSRHSLSLAYHPPYEYIKYEFECALCKGALRLRRWVYHCHLCRYVVHVKCATNVYASLAGPSDSHSSDNDEERVLKGPIDDVYKEIIRPFVKSERGEISLFVNSTIDGKFKFCNQRHPLTFNAFLPSSSSVDDNNQEEDEDEDDDDYENTNKSSEVVTCDGCTLPIHENKEDNNGYMSCDECQYFLHLACFNLPPDLPCNPLHPIKDHSLTLRNAGEQKKLIPCRICDCYTNGLYYACTQCDCFRIDIKCASLPIAIKHAAHPQHHHLSLLMAGTSGGYSGFCAVCYHPILGGEVHYRCDGCMFSMCGRCVLLPPRNKHRFDKHCLPLTYDAYVHHRGDFYCDSCEEKMNPKTGMYYCRDCDQCFHPGCFPATSGDFRNIKYGNHAFDSSVHHHPLGFQIVTEREYCELCGEYLYERPGFQCRSCYFATCFVCGPNLKLLL